MAAFNIVTYVLYVYKLRMAADPHVITLLAFLYFVPSAIEMIEDIQSGHESRALFFWIKIIGVLLALGYIGLLWFLISQYSQAFLFQLPGIAQNVMVGLPAIFLIRKVYPVLVVINQMRNKNISGKTR